MELLHPHPHPHPHPHAPILTRTVQTGLETASALALSTQQPRRRNTVVHPVAFVEKIPEDDRPNDHPP